MANDVEHFSCVYICYSYILSGKDSVQVFSPIFNGLFVIVEF